MRNFYSLRASLDGSLLRTSTMRGVEYLVCPVVSKLGNNVEWPVNAPTPELIPSNVLKFAIHSRNGRPFVMNHPRKDGEYVSANSPDILEKYSFGFVSSAYYDEEVGGAKCEVWIDPLQAEQVGRDAISIVNRLNNGETIEVSEGNYVIVREESGTFNGKPYGAVWELCINDHLAALPEGTIGACAIADGCGAGILKGSENREERSMNLELLVSDVKVKASALTQARTPTYSGTETSKWSAPSFADYVSSLHEGKDNPTSVAQCSSTLKGKIAAHSLLGDPSASNIRDLTLFPCVNPSNGKLNENALRAVLGGRGAAADISEAALNSARDVATRLLNKEFGAELSTSTSEVFPMSDRADRAIKTRSTFGRIVSSFLSSMKASMLSSTLRYKLEDAIKEADPSFYWLEAWDEANGFVVYMTRIVMGDEWDGKVETHCYQRDFSISGDGSITLGDSITEVEFTGSWTPVGKEEVGETEIETMTGDPDMEMEVGKSKQLQSSSSCACKGKDKNNDTPTTDPTEEMTMTSAEKKKELVTKLTTSGAYKGLDERTLNTLSEETLTSMIEVAEKATKEGKEVKEAKVEEGSGKVTVVVAEKKEDSNKPSEPKELTEDQWMKAAPPHLRDMAAKYKAAEEEHRSVLITSLKDSSAFSEEELQEMPTPTLEKVAKTAGVDQQITASSSYDYSGKGLPVSTPLSTGTKEVRKAPDTWAMSAAAHNKKDNEATN